MENQPIWHYRIPVGEELKIALKEGNITVTLSNNDIIQNDKPNNKWFTSIQYGTGINYKHQEVKDGYYKLLEPVISENNYGEQFMNIINNGFSEKIGDSKILQKMYENQVSIGNLLEPTLLIEKISEIIQEGNEEVTNDYTQEENNIFIFKKIIPFKQLLALYAINKITTKVNK